ncbi:MAG TPA: YfhO family protein [Pyrinomonadaceae bacterium]|nr:YfhO family protein [Pyrinomonadaceae bacterium]
MLFYALLYLIYFSPVIFRGTLLAVGLDAQNLYLPNFYSQKVSWDIFIFGGFPLMADPQVMTWYPPALILSQLPGTWNIFIIVAYIAASSLTYGYVHRLTGSKVAGLFSGIVYGMSGFMMAHLGHAVVIHSAAWIPLILWSLEELRRKVSVGWMFAGSFGIALSCLGGHSQIFVYGLLLSVPYALTMGWSAPVGRWRYYVIATLFGILGVGIAAIQIAPTIELVGLSSRVGYSFANFTVYALPPRQVLMIFLPYAFGGYSESGVTPYFGEENLTELMGYAGLLPLALAGVAVFKWKQKSLRVFWLCAGALSMLLAMGSATPLARLIYKMPILSQFRAPGRHLIEFTFAISVLSGLGIAVLIQQRADTRLLRKIVLLSSLGIAVISITILTMSGRFVRWAAEKGVELNLLSWAKEAVGVPLIIFVLAMAALIFWHKAPDSVWRNVLVFSIVIIDLGTFGWFYQWNYSTVNESVLQPNANAYRYKDSLLQNHQRLLPTHGTLAPITELPPNLSKLWGIPNASGYNSLIFLRLNRLLSMTDVGDVKALDWKNPDDQSLNLMAVRYLFATSNDRRRGERIVTAGNKNESHPSADITVDEQGTSWFKSDMNIALGSGCNQSNRDFLALELPTLVESNGIAVVTTLACSPQIPDGTAVAQLRMIEANGNVEVRNLVAGQDTSEWAYDCGHVKPFIKHRRAPIFFSYPAQPEGKPCEGHFYLTRFDWEGMKKIKSIEMKWISGSGSIAIQKLSLINHPSGSSTPVAATEFQGWRLTETADAHVYENLRAMPRAWLVPEVVALSADEALRAIKTSRLPDGRAFDAKRTALTEEAVTMPSEGADQQSTAQVTLLSDTEMEVRTSSRIASFLVTSDVYYPGWHASVDGKKVKLYQADYLLRGVEVPAGQHLVRFEYFPRRLFIGAGVSGLSLMVLGSLALANCWRVKRSRSGDGRGRSAGTL